MTTTEHEVAVFQQEDGWNFILVWIDHDDIAAFDGEFTQDDWQEAIEQHPFVLERNLPVVIAFEDENGDPMLYGAEEYVGLITEEFDWDGITWGFALTLDWGEAEDGDDVDEEDDDDYEDEEGEDEDEE